MTHAGTDSSGQDGRDSALCRAAGWESGPFAVEYALIGFQGQETLPVFSRMMENLSERYFAEGRTEQAVTAFRYKQIADIIQRERTSSPNDGGQT